ncbi:hypothetical protein DD595_25755, partial [Enterobacter cloacae complex sp. 4DZ3-17B2]
MFLYNVSNGYSLYDFHQKFSTDTRKYDYVVSKWYEQFLRKYRYSRNKKNDACINYSFHYG